MSPLPLWAVGAALLALLAAPPGRERRVQAEGASRAADSVNSVIGDASFVAAFGRLPQPADPALLRVATHLAYAAALLRSVDAGDLPASLRESRRTNLDRLRAYIVAAEFPDGEEPSDGWRPTFIDDRGRRCAVAYLVEQSAGSEAAFALDRRFHHASVAAIDDAAFEAWVASSGLTREELAIVQPQYRHRPATFWDRSTELESIAGLHLLQPVSGAPAVAGDSLPGLTTTLRLTKADGQHPRWSAAFDGELGRFPGARIFYDVDLRVGASHLWQPPGGRAPVPPYGRPPPERSFELGASIGAGVSGVSGLRPAVMTLPVDLFFLFDPFRPIARNFSDEGVGMQLRGRLEPAVLGGVRELLWTGAVDLMWYRQGRSRYQARLSAVARNLAGATWVGGELGFGFRTPVTFVRQDEMTLGD